MKLIIGAVVAIYALLSTGHPLDVKRALTTEVVYVTETVANVLVFIDENGKPYQTSTAQDTVSSAAIPSFSLAIPASTPVQTSQAPLPPPPKSLVTPTSTPTETPYAPPPHPSLESLVPVPSAPIETSQASPAPSPSSAVLDKPTTQSDSVNSLGIGITYDPFTGSQDGTRCKTTQEIANEFDRMKDYKIVRIYGMGCNIVPLAMQNVVKNGQKLMAGAYMSSSGNGEDLGTVITTLKSAVDQYASGNWNIVQLFSVENERVNDHDMTASAVVDAINCARSQLRGLGYNGPVSAVETVPAMIDNPAICQASDVVTVNCHAFFDSNTKAADAGTFVKSQLERVKSACNSKRVVVTESGWPHQGDANGNAVPSPDNQRIALGSLHDNFDHSMFIHNAFDSNWKADYAASFNAEQYWGVIS